MSPEAFVGVPDWRSLVLAALFTLPWLVFLARGWLRRPATWGVVAFAALLFPLSIALVQVPIQTLLGGLLGAGSALGSLPPRQVVMVALPSVFVSGLVQETTKLLVSVVGLRLLGQPRGGRAGLALGAAAGAGYGGFEAFWIFNLIFGMGWSLGTVQLAGLTALLGFVERFFTVPFHVGAAALAGYGYTTGRPWRFLLLAIGLHTIGNWAAVFAQVGLASVEGVEVWVALVASATIGAALWLRGRAGERSPIGCPPVRSTA